MAGRREAPRRAGLRNPGVVVSRLWPGAAAAGGPQAPASERLAHRAELESVGGGANPQGAPSKACEPEASASEKVTHRTAHEGAGGGRRPGRGAIKSRLLENLAARLGQLSNPRGRWQGPRQLLGGQR
jgi:hypothetical protein